MSAAVTLTDNSTYLGRMLSGLAPGLVGITGPAGAGKSVLSAALCRDGTRSVYSADSRFIGDSLERRALLTHKQARSEDDYRDGANQFNWWDWHAIERDLTSLAAGEGVAIEAPYDRGTGARSSSVTIMPRPQVIFEGALLGPPQIVQKLRIVIFVCLPAPLRLERIVKKDQYRRSFNEILARFLITELSETTYYNQLFAWAQEKLVFVDGLTGQPCAPFTPARDLFIPLRTKLEPQR